MRDNVDGVHTAIPLGQTICLLNTRDSLVRRGPRPPNDVGGRVDYLRECLPQHGVGHRAFRPTLTVTTRFVCLSLHSIHDILGVPKNYSTKSSMA